MTMFIPIYYPYLTLIDFCMHMHFLNRIRWLVFLINFEFYSDLSLVGRRE